MKQKYFLPLLGLLFSVGIVSSNAAESVGKINGSQESGKIEKQDQADINELSKKLRDAVNEKDLQKIEQISVRISEYIKQNKSGRYDWSWFIHNTIHQINRNDFPQERNSLLLKLFPMVLENIDGDAKVDLMSMYADFLEKNKLKTAEEIKQIRDGRESVANISLKKKFEIQIFNNELETADQIAEKMLKEQGTDKFDYNSVISAFSSKKVFGSQYAKKWYDQYLPIIHGDQKARKMTEYANFLRTYALADDDAVEKMLKDRFSVAGLTDNCKVSFYLADLSNNLTPDEYNKILDEALKTAGNNAALRMDIYLHVTQNRWNNSHRIDDYLSYVDFFENTVFKDPAVFKANHQFDTLLQNYVTGCRNARFSECEAFLQNLFSRSENKIAVRGALAVLYEKGAARYYDTDDPVMLKKAVNMYRLNAAEIQADKNIPAAKKDQQVIVLYKKIAEIAYKAADYDTVEKIISEVRKLGDEKLVSQNISHFDKFKAFVDYDEGKYESASIVLENIVKNDPKQGWDVWEKLVRSLKQAGKIEKAAEYLEKGLEKAPWYMRNRYKIVLEAMKQRMKK